MKTVQYTSVLPHKVGDKVLISEHGECTVKATKPNRLMGFDLTLTVDNPHRQKNMITYAEWLQRRESKG